MSAKHTLLSILLFFLAACAPAESTPTPLPAATATPTPPPQNVTLQFWTVLPDKGINEKNLDELVQAFQKEYPTITIKISSQPTYTELFRKVAASIAAGTLPDMVTGTDADIAQYARLKALTALDDFIGDGENGLGKSELANIPPALMETVRITEQGNKQYSLPFARGAIAVYYNWSAMKAIGITNTPRTWDEFRLHAKTLSRNPVRGFAYRPEAVIFDAMLGSRGGSLFNAELTRATFNSQAGVDALNYLGEGVKEGWIYRAEGAADMSDFAAGRTIFNLASTAAIPVYQEAINEAVKKGGKGFEWGVALLPQDNVKKPSAILAGSNIALMRNSPAKQQATWLFMRWLMRDKVSAQWTQSAGVLPVRQSARDALKDFFAKSPQHKQAFEDLLPVAHPAAVVHPAAEIRDLLEGAITAFESGKTAPKAALDDAAGKATILLSEKK